jgi:hypothetical protein
MNANMQVIEHRWGDRVQLEAPAELKTAHGHSLDVVIGNASLSGAFVQTRTRLPVLTCVALRAMNGSNEWLEACVVRHDNAGMGLEWLDPGLRSLSALLALRRHSGAPNSHESGSWEQLPRSHNLMPPPDWLEASADEAP